MKLVTIFAALALVLSTSVSANQQIPEKCPGVSAIQSKGFTRKIVLPSAGEWIVLGEKDTKYDTVDQWTLVVTIPRDVIANSKEAYQLARKSLETLNYFKGPEFYDGINAYGCEYRSNLQNVKIFTVTNLPF